jgi:hypothetical protein
MSFWNAILMASARVMKVIMETKWVNAQNKLN